eukprot:2003776-Pleurochrysis_carterae.AAC.2
MADNRPYLCFPALYKLSRALQVSAHITTQALPALAMLPIKLDDKYMRMHNHKPLFFAQLTQSLMSVRLTDKQLLHGRYLASVCACILACHHSLHPCDWRPVSRQARLRRLLPMQSSQQKAESFHITLIRTHTCNGRITFMKDPCALLPCTKKSRGESYIGI